MKVTILVLLCLWSSLKHSSPFTFTRVANVNHVLSVGNSSPQSTLFESNLDNIFSQYKKKSSTVLAASKKRNKSTNSNFELRTKLKIRSLAETLVGAEVRAAAAQREVMHLNKQWELVCQSDLEYFATNKGELSTYKKKRKKLKDEIHQTKILFGNDRRKIKWIADVSESLFDNKKNTKPICSVLEIKRSITIAQETFHRKRNQVRTLNKRLEHLKLELQKQKARKEKFRMEKKKLQQEKSKVRKASRLKKKQLENKIVRAKNSSPFMKFSGQDVMKPNDLIEAERNALDNQEYKIIKNGISELMMKKAKPIVSAEKLESVKEENRLEKKLTDDIFSSDEEKLAIIQVEIANHIIQEKRDARRNERNEYAQKNRSVNGKWTSIRIQNGQFENAFRCD